MPLLNSDFISVTSGACSFPIYYYLLLIQAYFSVSSNLHTLYQSSLSLLSHSACIFSPHLPALSHAISPTPDNPFTSLNSSHYSRPYSISTFPLGNFLQLLSPSLNSCYSCRGSTVMLSNYTQSVRDGRDLRNRSAQCSVHRDGNSTGCDLGKVERHALSG